ncbi:hypothetical protein BDP27DRAFT_1436589 [Rhodocollybia butyracea]|uniref:Uncharacterized protein n=1 Tax=Rhodocollybia butyracea TaxID=206335 RepID=A0A9P5TVI2_9AGAR|nr:hypothetical protein BDP27DRAFT_1436589 [Rhodocollybia butyracea]
MAYIAFQKNLDKIPTRTFDLKIFVEENNLRSKLTEKTHKKFENLASIVLTHLITSAEFPMVSLFREFTKSSHQAAEAFQQKFGKYPSDKNIRDKISSFLEMNRPSIIFAHLGGDSQKFVWGEVHRGGDYESRNEMFLSLELMKAISKPRRLQDKARAQVLRSICWMITFMHELMHCISKHLFRNILTPKIYDFVEDPRRKDRGEIGTTFELKYVGFVLELMVNKSANIPGSRLWHPDMRIIARLPDCRNVLLDARTIRRIIASFSKADLWQLKESVDFSLPSHEIKDPKSKIRIFDFE